MTPELRPIIMRSNRMLGAALVESNLVSIDDLETANSRLFEHLNGTEPRRCSVLGILVNDLQVLKEDDVFSYILENEGIGLIDLEAFEVPADIKRATDVGECWATWTVPVDKEDDLTLLASAHYLSPAVRAHWEKKVGGPILWYATSINHIADYLERVAKPS